MSEAVRCFNDRGIAEFSTWLHAGADGPVPPSLLNDSAFSAPLSEVLIGSFGWRGAYLAQGGFMAAAFLPLAALFRGAEPPHSTTVTGRAVVARGWTLHRAMRTPHFWLLFLVYVFTGLGSFLVALHQLAFAVTIGFDTLVGSYPRAVLCECSTLGFDSLLGCTCEEQGMAVPLRLDSVGIQLRA